MQKGGGNMVPGAGLQQEGGRRLRFANEDIGAQRGEGPCPRSHSYQSAEPGLESGAHCLLRGGAFLPSLSLEGWGGLHSLTSCLLVPHPQTGSSQGLLLATSFWAPASPATWHAGHRPVSARRSGRFLVQGCPQRSKLHDFLWGLHSPENRALISSTLQRSKLRPKVTQ